MPSFNKFIISVSGLAAMSTASTITPSSKALFGRQHYTDCGRGTSWYVCANGYRGCFASDPCALPPISASATALVTTSTTITTITATSLAYTSTSTTTAATTATSTAITASAPVVSATTLTCPAASQTASVFMPTMYNLFTGEPDTAQDETSYIQVQTLEQFPQLQQVAVFRNVPANAKNCILRWNQADKTQRSFFTEDNAALRVWQITSDFPAAGASITPNAVDAMPKAENPSKPELSGWDDVESARKFTFASVDCAKDIVVFLEIDVDPSTARGDGHLFMEQDFQNGISLEYTC